ncbi:PAS domain-containing protein [Aquincola sp. MAHUQ-54]|uniref:Virulence sensor protein BvgS n=1 Tax=Aquincola agrisoli TaxID=3119538 RepID=A0AAW9QG26_9BURK
MASSDPDRQPAGDLPRTTAGHTARLERALDSSLDGFWEYNLRTGDAWYSHSLRRMLGDTAQAAPDMAGRLSSRLHPDDAAGFIEAVDRAAARGTAFEREARLRDGEGRWRWFRARGRVWPGADGRPELLAGSLTDVHEACEARAALARMSERYERAVLATPHGLFERMLDEDTMYMSDPFWHALGYAPGELPSTRSTFVRLMHPDDLAPYQARVDEATRAQAPLDVRMRLRSKSGAYRWFQQLARLHRQPDGRLCAAGVLVDIDEQVSTRAALERGHAELERLVAERTMRLEAALALAEQARSEAERATAAKSLFVAHMSHEIRTPLNGVLGLTELALQMAVSPTQRRHLEVALQSGQSLLQVVDEVLDFSRTQRDAGPVANEPFDLSELLAATMRSVMPMARGSHVAMRFDWEGRRTRVRGDPARLRQIVINLLGNALKFTERGHVGMRTDVEDGGDGRCTARIRIEDTGPGIAADQQARVFEAFVQADASLSRRHGGAGLGLATARALAQALGGSIALRSEVGQGSEFLLTLPLDTDGPPDPELPPPEPLWVVSPNANRVHWTHERLQRMGGEVRSLESIDAAVRLAGTLPPGEHPVGVLVSQWCLTDPAGLLALRAELPRAQIALMQRPDWHQPALEQAAEALNIHCALMPLTPRALRALMSGQAGPLPPAHAPPPPEAEAPAPAAPLAAGQPVGYVLLVEDNPVNRMIGEGFLRALGLDPRTADDGVQALAACAADTPALVLMDLQMPVMDGLEATRRLRALQRAGRLPYFPIIALTAHALQSDRDLAAAAGMDGYLTKPLMLEALRSELQQWLPLPPGTVPQ